MTSLLDQALAAAIASVEQHDAEERYRRDPFAPLADGRIRLWDADANAASIFVPYQHQLDTIANWMDLELLGETGELRYWNEHIEKSRQMGETWILAYAEWWALRYHDGAGLFMHRKQSEVDDGGPANTIDSFFGKVRFINEHCDPELRSDLKFVPFSNRDAQIINRDHPQRFLRGVGQTTDPGRGGRYRRAIIDEAAHILWSGQVQAALDPACPSGQCWNSTPRGRDNAYYRIRQTRPEGWRLLRFHWSQHPVYSAGLHTASTRDDDGRIIGGEPTCALCRAGRHRYPGKLTSPWYEQRIGPLTDQQVAQELDIDYTGSLEARVYPEWSADVHCVERIAYDEHIPLDLAWDYGLDSTPVLVLQNAHDSLRLIGLYEGTDETPDEVSRGLRGLLRDLGVRRDLVDDDGSKWWTRQITAYGDPAGEGRDLATGRSLVDEYRRNGFNIQPCPVHSVEATINSVKRLLRGIPKPLRVSAATCGAFVEHIEGNVWPVDRDGRRRVGAARPLDNAHNHAPRALAYYAAARFPVPGSTEPAHDDYHDDGGRIAPGLSYGSMF